MNIARPYLPLIGFVIPTLIVGYGFVIPRSCIAGVNELSVGFGTTVFGAILTYLAGQRAVMPKGVCTRPPLRVRMARALNRQAASPSGFMGLLLGFIWPREHGRLNAEVLEHLDMRSGHRVLEVGFGSGHALRAVAGRIGSGSVVGIDVSELMAELARRRNRCSIARGNLDVRVGDVGASSVEEAAFDRVFSVHCIYFWRDQEAVLAKLARALKPGGKLVLAFRPDGDDVPDRFRDPVYRFPRLDQVAGSLGRLGLTVEHLAPSTTAPSTMILGATKS